MGMLALKLLLRGRQHRKRQRRRRRIRARDGSLTSVSKAKRDFPCRLDDNYSRRGKRLRYSGPDLPEDIWCKIHSLMPIQDSARTACVSRVFLRSWRHYPNLILTKETLGSKQNACGKDDIARAFTNKVDQILKNHSGTGVKIFELNIVGSHNLDACYLNNWLQIAITKGIENLTLSLPLEYEEWYSFPCSLLFGENGSLIRHLELSCCTFRPTVGLGCLRSLTKLHLHRVRITGEELGHFLSSSFALQELELSVCSEIISLKVPCVLEQLSGLTLSGCSKLQVIECKAPNLITFEFYGDLGQLSLGRPLQAKNVVMECLDESNFLRYAITELPYIVPNVETLNLCTISEMVNTPMVAAKFLHLKFLEMYLDMDLSPKYDYLSLVSFLNASPVLETFILGLPHEEMMFDSIFGDPLHHHMRQTPEHKHVSLKNVKILGFCSARSMVELTLHIIKNVTSLECVTLDTVFDPLDEEINGRCSVNSAVRTGSCHPRNSEVINEASKGLLAIETYIVGEVPSTVKLDVRGPCSLCHALEL